MTTPRRLSLGLEPRPLFDMNLDIAGDILPAIRRGGDLARVLAVFAQRIGERDAVAIRQRQRGAVKHARAGRGRRERRREARALLVAERQHVKAERQLARFGKFSGRENSSDHTERAVVFAGVDHGVDMRTDQQPPALAPAPAHGAKRVFADREAGLAHPFRHQIGGAAVLRRQEQPHQPVRFGRDRAELGDDLGGALAERLRINRHLCAFTQRPSLSRSSSVMPVWLPSGMERFCTVCSTIGSP